MPKRVKIIAIEKIVEVKEFETIKDLKQFKKNNEFVFNDSVENTEVGKWNIYDNNNIAIKIVIKRNVFNTIEEFREHEGVCIAQARNLIYKGKGSKYIYISRS